MNGTNLRDALESGKFAVTSEVGPPKGTDLKKMIEHIHLLKGLVDGINVTDNQSSVMRLSSLGGTCIIKEAGGEPILQVTCRDRNRMGIQSDLLFAYSRGIRNVLCLTGDAVVVGDHPTAKGVFDLDSVQLLDLFRVLETGKDMGGNKLDGAVSFFRGSTVTPEAQPLAPQMLKFEKKVEAGAQFFQTQAVYDMDALRRFMDRARKHPVKILAGILVLASAKMAKYLNDKVPGVFVPAGLIEELEGAPKGGARKKGVEIAARMVRQIKEEKTCDGVHIMAIGMEEVVPEILKLAGVQTDDEKTH
jgi:methylenetetrahydrofolate reductase (NADPH)